MDPVAVIQSKLQARIADLEHVLEVLRDADNDRKGDVEWPTFPPQIRAMIDKALEK